jgi:hypothetical protein
MCEVLFGGLQACAALGLEIHTLSVVKAAREHSFLPLLSLLDPRTLDPTVAELAEEQLRDAVLYHSGGRYVGRHYAVDVIFLLLRELLYVDPNANMLANGVRPLSTGSRLSLHSSRVTALQFPMWVRGDDDSVVSSRGTLSLGDAATKHNPFYDSGVVKYYLKAGGASPPTPFSGRKVLAAAVWYV